MLTKKIAVIFLTVLMIFSLAGISASAATTTQDGLEVTLTTDKTDYTKNEQITATLKVKNTNSEAVSNVTLETVVPTGFKVADNASSTKSVGTLNGNAEEQLTVKLVKDDSGDSTIKSPKTGEETNYLFIVLSLVISGAAIFVAVKPKKKIQAMSLVLGILIFSQVVMPLNLTVNAESSKGKISISTTVKFDSSNLDINSYVMYGNEIVNNGKTDDSIGEIYFSPVDENHVAVSNDGITKYADNELLVVAKPGVTKSQIEALAKQYNAEIVGYIEKTGDYQLQVKSGNLDTVIQEMKEDELLLDVSLNYIAELSDNVDITDIHPGERYIASVLVNSATSVGSGMWGHETIKARSAWYVMSRLAIPESQYIKVGLIDNQFYRHEDLGFAEILYETALDESFHGTHVAGTMAARGDNQEGICGVYPYANGRLYGVSANGIYGHSENGTFQTSIMGEKVGLSELIFRNVKVINQSMGSNWNKEWKAPDGTRDKGYLFFTQKYYSSSPLRNDTTYEQFVDYLLSDNDYIDASRVLKDFLDRTLKLGYDYVIVTAAGNDSEKDTHYNAKVSSWLTFIDDDTNDQNLYDSYDRIIVVGSVGKELDISNFSNSGDRVDVYAPGESILSLKNTDSYVQDKGTSMSSPHVAGVAANIFTVNNNLTGKQVKKIIRESTLEESKTDYPVIDSLASVLSAINENGEKTNNTVLTNGAIEGWVFNNTQGTQDYDDTWEGIADCTVTLKHHGDNSIVDTTTTDSLGHYEFIVPAGEYDVTAHHDVYGERSIPTAGNDPITVFENQVSYAAWIVYDGVISSTVSSVPGRQTVHTLLSNAEWAWTEYDHPDFDTPEGYNKHIIIDDKNIRMYGPGDNSSTKVLEFDIQRDQTSGKDSENNWHSMKGGGFLFNTAIDEENNKINGYYILITENGLELFRLDDMDFDRFRNSYNEGSHLQQFNFSDRFASHHIKLEVTSTNVSLWDGENKIIDNYSLPETYGNGFGPITTHKSHDCDQRSYFTFSNITMQTR